MEGIILKNSNKATISIFAVIAIAAAALYFYNGAAQLSCGEYKDGLLCTPKGTDPIQYTQDMIRTSTRVTIVFEAEPGKTSNNAIIDASATQLAIYFGSRNPDIYGIEVENGAPITCINSQNKSVPLDTCRSIKAGENGLVVWLKYPIQQRNEIIVSPGLIEFHAKGVREQFALVRAMFGKIFFP
ncbi:hypothetical protein HYS54_04605 [Candidatus Micrarchaeota archaeon]|nr:hypothetical protein [Candidatus Micrarchaeota archaeon]